MFPLNLSGKKALVCGSTQGIGFATAKALSQLGVRCTLMARNETALESAVAQLTPVPEGTHTYLVADFSDAASLEAAVAQAGTQTFDILINNTGGPAAGPIRNATGEQFLAAFHQHLLANHALATALLPHMEAQKWGRIVNVVSTSVKIPLKGLGVSNTIRGSVASWAKTLSNEVARYGITVNNVLPGATATGRLDAIISGKAAKATGGRDGVEDEMLAEIPARRFGQPDEIGAVIAFLCSDAAAYINGVSIPVDGGRTGSL
ncbi:MAG: SDR family oxidoreductase [Sphingobacteriales bacterium]|nr:MAG: SDR family oxidoreductase [Sphingobacteriales bacterium]